MRFNWSDPNPVFFDFETQSACDLKQQGGYIYAMHPSTRLLCMSIAYDNTLIVWVPGLAAERVEPTRDCWQEGREDVEITIYGRQSLPELIVNLIKSGRTFAAHNLGSFDYHIWKRFIPVEPAAWIDTLYLTRAAGLPGSLDQLGKKLLNEGKDAAKLVVKKLWNVTEQDGSYYYPPVLPGMVAPLVRYAGVDSLIMKEVYPYFDSLRVEADVIDAFVEGNQRGVKIDNELAFKIEQVSQFAQSKAEEEILQLVGKTKDEFNIRSHVQMKKWLAEHNVVIKNWEGKESLNKKAVDNFFTSNEIVNSPNVGTTGNVDPIVFQVLDLRGVALRITDAKMKKAQCRMGEDGRAYDLLSYHQAHTGRSSSSGIQVHNLPKAKKGIDVNGLLAFHESGNWAAQYPSKAYDVIRSTLPETKDRKKRVSVDDALSALIRPVFVPADGYVFGIADYSAIEARCISWMSGETGILEEFARGADPYITMASRIYGVPIDKVDDDQRQIGKITILGCGYGMSSTKFQLFCAQYGILLDKAGTTAEACVEGYRQAFPKIAGKYSGVIRDGQTKQYRQGGIWDQLERAARNAITEGGTYTCGKCTFRYVGRILKVGLPSGREIWYNNCRIEDRVPGYCFTLGLEPKFKPTIVYDSPTGERSMYGGKWAENCLAGNTLILTDTGAKQLDAIQLTDRIWDGESFVEHEGLIHQGVKEVVTWQGLQLTGNHLIHDGNCWKPVIHMDGGRTDSALRTGRYSAVLRYLNGLTQPKGIPSVSVHAGESVNCRIVESGESRYSRASSVTGVPERGQKPLVSSPILSYDPYGFTDIAVSYPDATTLTAKPIGTTAVEEYVSLTVGDTTNLLSLDMHLLWKIGIELTSIWTGKTTTGIMNPEIYGLLVEWKIAVTNAITSGLSITECLTRFQSSAERFYQTGLVSTPYAGILTVDGMPPKSSQSTIEVYDIRNCGPNNRFAVLTDSGEVIVHNCSQAISRDIMMCAKVRLMKAGIRYVLDVHDEIISEIRRSQENLNEITRIMSEVPKWADGFPIEVKGHIAPRYLKDPPKGFEKAVARNGQIV